MSTRRAVLAVIVALGSTSGCTCSSNTASPLDAGTDTAGGAGGASGRGGASGAQDARDEPEAAACSTTPQSSAIPPGWVRFPGLPCACDIWVAPSAEHMGPKPSWITGSDGIIELENNWADPLHGIWMGSVLGDLYRGEQLISFGRYLGSISGTLTSEWVVLRVPADETVFRARVPGGMSGACGVFVKALGQGSALYRAWEARAGLAPTPWALAGGPARIGVPDPIYAEASGDPAQDLVIGRGVLASKREPGARVDVMLLGVDRPEFRRIAALPQRDLTLLGAWDSSVFFVEYTIEATRAYGQIWVWDVTRGLRPLLPRTGDDPGQVASTCGLGTDGQTMVWTQYSGWTGAVWERIDVMTAPFTTDERALAPVRLRSLRGGDGSCRTWRVGGGHAAGHQGLSNAAGPPPPEEIVIVRLSDGQAWTIKDRPGKVFGLPLYVTESETAMEEALKLPHDAGLIGSLTVVRYPLAVLGPGTPASEVP